MSMTLNDDSTCNPQNNVKEHSTIVGKIQTEMFIDETEKTWYKKRKFFKQDQKHAPETASFQSQSRHHKSRPDPPGFVCFISTQKKIHLALLYEASAATALAKEITQTLARVHSGPKNTSFG